MEYDELDEVDGVDVTDMEGKDGKRCGVVSAENEKIQIINEKPNVK